MRMRCKWLTVIVVFMGSMFCGADWTAYNDLVWSNGQPSASITTYSPSATTNGYLIDHGSGGTLGAELRFFGPVVTAGAPLGSNPVPTASDAHTEFGSAINGDGFVYLGTTGTLFFTVTHLDTNSRFDVVIYSSRQAISDSYSNRWTEIQLSDCGAGFTNTSSAGVPVIQAGGLPNDTSRVLAGNTNGMVARYTGINPGSDGDFDINILGYATAGYSTNAYVNAIKVVAHGQGSTYQEGTDFEATSVAPSNGQLVTRWRVTPNLKHRIQYKATLSATHWSVYVTNLSSTCRKPPSTSNPPSTVMAPSTIPSRPVGNPSVAEPPTSA